MWSKQFDRPENQQLATPAKLWLCTSATQAHLKRLHLIGEEEAAEVGQRDARHPKHDEDDRGSCHAGALELRQVERVEAEDDAYVRVGQSFGTEPTAAPSSCGHSFSTATISELKLYMVKCEPSQVHTQSLLLR